MATDILEQEFGFVVYKLDGNDVAFDVHLARVFPRYGLAQRDDLDRMAKATRLGRPERPGSLDLPVWKIGRQ